MSFYSLLVTSVLDHRLNIIEIESIIDTKTLRSLEDHSLRDISRLTLPFLYSSQSFNAYFLYILFYIFYPIFLGLSVDHFFSLDFYCIFYIIVSFVYFPLIISALSSGMIQSSDKFHNILLFVQFKNFKLISILISSDLLALGEVLLFKKIHDLCRVKFCYLKKIHDLCRVKFCYLKKSMICVG